MNSSQAVDTQRETALRTIVDKYHAIERRGDDGPMTSREREWWRSSYDEEVRAGEQLFAAFVKMRDERDNLKAELARLNNS